MSQYQNSKAFDTIDLHILLYKLKFYGFQSNSVDLLASYLSNRYQYVQYKDVSSESMLMTTGIPQLAADIMLTPIHYSKN